MISARSLFPVLNGDRVAEKSNQSVILLEKNEPEETYNEIKKRYGIDKIFRLSVFLTAKGVLIFSAPSGPDMNETPDDLLFCSHEGAFVMKRLGITPFIGVISGGRKGDVGRNATVDKTIQDADAVTKILAQEQMPSENYTILIEDAVKEANFLICPDSLSGEMILKTAAGVGEGREIGNVLLLKRKGGGSEGSGSGSGGSGGSGSGNDDSGSDNDGSSRDVPFFLEQLTKKADPDDLKILKEALETL
ncbi:MAG: hypothetical protein FWE54_01570 [Methanimicrococcus sp.]|nr:hypothetical protein [Methanimicrococcus sp.]